MAGNLDPTVLNANDVQGNPHYPAVAQASIWEKVLWDDVLKTLAGKVRLVTTTPYTATTADDVILVDASAGPITINLPTAVQSGTNKNPLRFIIKKIDSSGNAVTVDGSASQTIDGALTKVLSAQWDSVSIIGDNANWQALTPAVPTTLASWVPTRIPSTDTFTVPIRAQALFAQAIDCEGTMVIDGTLVAVL